MADPHYQARENIVSVPDGDFGSVRMQNVVPRSRARRAASVTRAAPWGPITPRCSRGSGSGLTSSGDLPPRALSKAEARVASGSYDGVFIVGCGQTEYTRRTDKAIQRLIWEAIDLALRSAICPGRRWMGSARAASCFRPTTSPCLRSISG